MTSNKSRLNAPKRPRQTRTVGVSTETLREKKPAVLHATVAPVTQRMPKRCLDTGTHCIARLLDQKWASVGVALKTDKAGNVESVVR